MKVFFMSTHANQGTGYGRVANKMTNYMANMSNVEVVFYGFQNYPGQAVSDRFIDPRIKFYDAIELDPEAPKGFGDDGNNEYVNISSSFDVKSTVGRFLDSLNTIDKTLNGKLNKEKQADWNDLKSYIDLLVKNSPNFVIGI